MKKELINSFEDFLDYYINIHEKRFYEWLLAEKGHILLGKSDK